MKNKFLKMSLILLVCCFMIGCGSASVTNKDLNGEWHCNKNNANYVFNEDGTGYCYITGKEDVKIQLKYELDDDSISITSSLLGREAKTKFDCKVDGDKLTLSNSTKTLDLERK